MPCATNIGLLVHMSRYVGETVTIYTTSGGESGEGFTGVLMGVNRCFVRLLVDFGPAPACALGSCCERRCRHHHGEEEGNVGTTLFADENEENENIEGERRTRFDCRLRRLGAVVDIPVDRIAAFVHNAV